jgi:hypothetical protein
MNNRKPAFLFMCAAEALRACLAFSSFLPLLMKNGSHAALLAAMIASPQLLIPLMWYYLWREPAKNSGMKDIVLTGKILSAAADIAWAVAFFIGLGSGKPVMGNQIIGIASFWGILILMDLSLTATSFILARGIKAEEG